jgi:hypothetical protein
MYLNGTADTVVTVMNTLSASILNTAHLNVGSWGNFGGRAVPGNICELSVYNRVLTAPEVVSIYNNGKPTNLIRLSSASAMLNWWRLGTLDTYSVATDQMGVQNGTMTNMAATDIIAVGAAP